MYLFSKLSMAQNFKKYDSMSILQTVTDFQTELWSRYFSIFWLEIVLATFQNIWHFFQSFGHPEVSWCLCWIIHYFAKRLWQPNLFSKQKRQDPFGATTIRITTLCIMTLSTNDIQYWVSLCLMSLCIVLLCRVSWC
jgi:hypothetical protein